MKKLALILATVTVFAVSNLLIANDWEEKLTSESFEIQNLVNEVSGFYLDYSVEHTTTTGQEIPGLVASWRIVNNTENNITYNVIVEKIRMHSSHWINNCLGEGCYMTNESQTPKVRTSTNLTLFSKSERFSYYDQYLPVFSGWLSNNAAPGIDTFKITYRNVNDSDDYVTFLCIWDFHINSIRVIEDISQKVFPNPTAERLNLVWGENNFDEIEFFDVNGNKLFSQTVSYLSEADIDVSVLNSGVYVGYLVRAGKRIKVFRFIKN